MQHWKATPHSLLEGGARAKVHLPALAYWESLPARGATKCAAAFDLGALGKVANHTIMLDVEHDPADFVVRSVGDALLSFLRGDQTGMRLSDDPQKTAGSELWRQLAHVVEVGEPTVFETPYNGNFWDIYGIRQLVCPLSATGDRVDRLFTTLVFVPKSG